MADASFGGPAVDEDFDVISDISDLPQGDVEEGTDENVVIEDSPDSQIEEQSVSDSDSEAVVEEDQPEESEEQLEEEAPPKEAKSPKAQNRFQELANRAKQAEDYTKQVVQDSERRFEQMQQQFSQREQQLLSENRAVQERLLNLVEGRESRDAEARMTPEERAERKWLDKAAQASKQHLDPEFAELKNEVQALRQEREQAKLETKKAQSRQHWRGQASNAAKAVFKDVDISYDQEALTDAVLTFGVAKGLDPQQAASEVKALCEAYYKGKLAKVSKQGAKITGAQAQAKQASMKYTKDPSLKELAAAGYKGPEARWNWLGAGAKPIPKLK